MYPSQQNKNNLSHPLIIISTYRALLPKILIGDEFLKGHLKLEREGLLNIENFLNHLLDQGYQSSGMIEQSGQFSQRGGIIDVFPFTEENPLRIELDGDRISSLRLFDPENRLIALARIKENEAAPFLVLI